MGRKRPSATEIAQAVLQFGIQKKAAEAMGWSETHLGRWLKEPDVEAEMVRLKDTAFALTMRKLQYNAALSVDELEKIILDAKMHPATKVHAIKLYLELGLKCREGERLDKIEAQLAELQVRQDALPTNHQ